MALARSRVQLAYCKFRLRWQPSLTGVLGADGEEDLANVDTGDSAVGLAVGTTHSGLQSIGTSARQHLVDTDDVVRVGAHTKVERFLATVLHEVPFACVSAQSSIVHFLSRSDTHLLAQIRAASRASELSCSYSLETRWTQRGNSSTFARLRPRSKIRILGSGTPRLKRDFGYGYHSIIVSMLSFIPYPLLLASLALHRIFSAYFSISGRRDNIGRTLFLQ